MNKLIQNLAQISDAAEYFDRKTGAAWKIRAALTNMVVWAANGLLYAQRSDSVERMARSMIEVATLRAWARDCSCNALALDLTSSAVRRTLGLERVIDAHEEACRVARQKCLQTRSAMNFKKFYDAALAALDEQRKQREDAVEKIAETLADNEFPVSADVADYFEAFLGMKLVGGTVSDIDLYDDASVERQADQLAETVGNALESMYDVCEAELAGAITADKIGRLSGYHKAINNMLLIAGVDMTKLAQRRAKLEALIDAQVNEASGNAKKVDADIEAQIAAMSVDKFCDVLAANPEPAPKKMKRVKKTDSLKKLGELVA